jgi:hypothetical protein
LEQQIERKELSLQIARAVVEVEEAELRILKKQRR